MHSIFGLARARSRFLSWRLTRGNLSVWLLLTGLLLAPIASADTVAIEDLGLLPGGTISHALGISADGSVVAGAADSPSGFRAFRWTQAGGMQDLGVLPGGSKSTALAVSADGLVVVGFSTVAAEDRVFRWTQAGGMQDIGPGIASGVSADGSVVAGVGTLSSISSPTVFRWTATGGTEDLGAPAGVLMRSATVSADGLVVVAHGNTTGGGSRSFRWTQADGMQDLGFLPGGNQTYANAVSADGSVVVGHATTLTTTFTGTHAFRWTQASGMQDLGHVPGSGGYSAAHGVSADGAVVVGEAYSSSSNLVAMRWTQAGGMQELDAQPGGIGSYVSAGFSSRARAVSADGSVVAGAGTVSSASYHASRWTILKNGVATTPVGSNISVSTSVLLPDGSSSTNLSVTFDSVVAGGQTSVTTSSTGAPPPPGFKLGQPPVYYDVSTTATFTGSAQVCFSWVEGQFHNENSLKLWHMENSGWHDVTVSLDTTTNTICGQVTSFSPFVITEKAYNFTGFFQPVDNSPTLNSAKAGSAVPVKFSLGGYQGMTIFDAGSPRLLRVACPTGALVDAIEQTATNSLSGLTYDTASGQYSYVWKTDKSYAGNCMQLILDFNDGTQKRASFSFQR